MGQAARGNLELSSGKKSTLAFGSAFVVAGVVLSTIVFPFWNFIREDVYEDTVILSNDNGTCYVETTDMIPKTVENCQISPGDTATVKFGKGLAWATLVDPGS